jgi:hypothetical protein
MRAKLTSASRPVSNQEATVATCGKRVFGVEHGEHGVGERIERRGMHDVGAAVSRELGNEHAMVAHEVGGNQPPVRRGPAEAVDEDDRGPRSGREVAHRAFSEWDLPLNEALQPRCGARPHEGIFLT